MEAHCTTYATYIEKIYTNAYGMTYARICNVADNTPYANKSVSIGWITHS